MNLDWLRNFRRNGTALGAAAFLCAGHAAFGGDADKRFVRDIRPILEAHCFDCHADGAKRGGIAFDGYATDAALTADSKLWTKVLKNVRAGLMPPAKKPRVAAEDIVKLADWIKTGALGLDPANPDPGRVTLRRLNRTEYRRTIRDLMGIDFRTDEEFPADDTGYGFDNIGDVLTTSPLLLEKYMQAAEVIVARAVPQTNRVPASRRIAAAEFSGVGGLINDDKERAIPLHNKTDLAHGLDVRASGTYRVDVQARVRGSFDFDPSRASAAFDIDGAERWREELAWKDNRRLDISAELKWEPGGHPLRLRMEPVLSADKKPGDRGDGDPWVDLRLESVTVTGPLEREQWVAPPGYTRFFTREAPPADAAERRAYAAEVLRRFASRAFRRPVDDATVEKLTSLAEEASAESGTTFEQRIARAMTAVLASPRFLFRMENTLPATDGRHPLLDEYSLASRLSYFLWSTMPDEELTAMAARRELRPNLTAQVRRMLTDDRARELVENFTGQWLQTRDVDSVSIDARIVLARDSNSEKEITDRMTRFRTLGEQVEEARKAGDDARVASLRAEIAAIRAKFPRKRVEFSQELRRDMRREIEMSVSRLIREDRSVLELINSDETFLNGALAAHYGIPGVEGKEMRVVKLPPDSVRGGILTTGAVLAVTSNPTRTSPVKRGLFILENILGTPPLPPPPNVPALEESAKAKDGREPSLREALALHRAKPLCASCHNRMDPLGLAFENFNAMGLWRDQERGQPIPAVAGTLITGENFASVRELKQLLVTARRADFYRCLTEKLLTYALGRGPEACDITAVDAIVERLEREGGRFSALIAGVIESAPFQRRRAMP